MQNEKLKLASVKDCRVLAQDSIKGLRHYFCNEEGVARAVAELGGALEVILFDWTFLNESSDRHVCIPVNENGSEETSWTDVFTMIGRPRLRDRERLRLMQFRKLALLGYLQNPQVPIATGSRFGMVDVEWYDVIDRQTGGFLDFDDFYHAVARLGRAKTLTYYMRGPLTLDHTKRVFDEHPNVMAVRARPVTAKTGPDGRRLEFIFMRCVQS